MLALLGGATIVVVSRLRVNVQNCIDINPLNAELNPICHLLASLGGATVVVVSRLRVNFERCGKKTNVEHKIYAFHTAVLDKNIYLCKTVKTKLIIET